MSSALKVIFSPILILWWLTKLIIQVLFVPIRILWTILRMVLPELTRPFDSLAHGLSQMFRLT
jgi:hypothetical protein